MIWLGLNIFFKFADENFVVCFLILKELNNILLVKCKYEARKVLGQDLMESPNLVRTITVGSF